MEQAVRTKRLEPRKVLGEENPADLFAKHSLSRARFEKLGGRAESAPQVRKGELTRFILADADLFTIDSPGDGAPELEP